MSAAEETKLDTIVNPSTEDTGDQDDGDNDNGPAPEEESTATFAPVVQLEVVEVKTMEENEVIVYKQRAKLYIYGETMLDKGTGNKTWRERGVGDCKLLRHKESGRIRVLMRQEKTMKVIVNHFLDPRIVLVPNAGSDKSWCWNAFDFAECSLIETTFALKFSSPEVATEFKNEFVEGQDEMTKLLSGGDATTTNKEEITATAELSSAIESLSVGSAGTTAPAETTTATESNVTNTNSTANDDEKKEKESEEEEKK